ncbi:hypothetical protein LSM04_004175 [Trypanosoma melophagium]|uniref:uncharacterized protein n=1 Tax=Trypanosoma melophagium TaxID=715481 RepID=UPI003519E6DC|nr:hypothetical protein LSM04_004175 [Trypanosoma melophagium]
MYSRKNSPPKRLLSRSASGIPLPPKFPTYRAPHRYSFKRYKNSNNNSYNNSNSKTPGRSTRFLLPPQPSPTSVQHQEWQKNIINGKCRDGSSSRRRPVLEYGNYSPSPRKPPVRRSLDSSLNKEDNLNGMYVNDTKTPLRDVYQVYKDVSNKTSGLDFCGLECL